MLYRKRFYLREMPNSSEMECRRSTLRNSIHARPDEGKRRRLPASASQKASDIVREVMEIWKARKAGIHLEDIL